MGSVLITFARRVSGEAESIWVISSLILHISHTMEAGYKGGLVESGARSPVNCNEFFFLELHP